MDSIISILRNESKKIRKSPSPKDIAQGVIPWGLMMEDENTESVLNLLDYQRIPRESMLEVAKRSQMKCEFCSTSLQKKPYRIYHINGDTTCVRPDNLQFLCPDCHTGIAKRR